ncbi:hypothetical protein ARALYDRAFT_893744 [Arabidopsis lyrata subsp. lyrata]|uniref:Uncharacterized protein n=1 Tax=Arabidopsis lyrata subsp. lyrata TaxID=81972 RepID=D7KYM0_ARALL|nr:hypothetical protein ARALYDRAFT_893744 [Arabidopsis lyrata subsp. lyrata]
MGDSCLIIAYGDQTGSNFCCLQIFLYLVQDGCFALLDLICKSSSHKEEFCINSIGMVKGSHQSPLSKRIRRRKDEITIATAGAPDKPLCFTPTLL